MAAGTALGVLLAAVDLLRGASEGQVQRIDETLGRMDTKLDKLDKLDTIDGKMDQQTVVLEQIRDRL